MYIDITYIYNNAYKGIMFACINVYIYIYIYVNPNLGELLRSEHVSRVCVDPQWGQHVTQLGVESGQTWPTELVYGRCVRSETDNVQPPAVLGKHGARVDQPPHAERGVGGEREGVEGRVRGRVRG